MDNTDRYKNTYSLSTMLKHNGSLDKLSGRSGQYFIIYRKDGLLYVMTSRSGETFNLDRGHRLIKLSRGRLIQVAISLGEDMEQDDDLSLLFRINSKLRGVNTGDILLAVVKRCENKTEIQSGSFIQRPQASYDE